MGQVVSQEEILRTRGEWKSAAKRVVFVVGCFDLLHPGHIRLLEQAHDYGNIVTVAVLSDESVASSIETSPLSVNRPITSASERAEIIAALAAVDYAFEIDIRTLPRFVATFRPDAVVDGAEPIFRSPVVPAAQAARIEVIRIPLEPGHSSSRLIERIAQLRT